MSKYKKFAVHTPLSHCEKVREAMGQAGAGKFGEYSHCSFSVRGTGRYQASSAANPYLTRTSESVQKEEEEKIEAFCLLSDFPQVIEAIKAAHPYEEPVISAWDVEIY